MTATVSHLGKKLAEVMAATGWTEKRGRNKDQGYDFVQAVDIFAEVRRELSQRNVAFLFTTRNLRTTIIPRDAKTPAYLTEMEASYSFVDGETGEVLGGDFCGSSIDTSDKGPWKCITGMLKYIAISVFLLPTGDDPERDDASTPRVEKVTANPASSTTTSRKGPPSASTGVGLTNDQRALLISEYRRHGLVGEQMRWANYQITHKMSTTQMTNEDMDKLMGVLTNGGDEAMLEAAKAVDPKKPEKKE